MEIQFTKQGQKIIHDTGVVQLISLEQLQNQKNLLLEERKFIDEQISNLDNSINAVKNA